MLVTDTSGSMAATDVEPSRLDAAKDAAGRFLDRVPDELRVGLVAFSDAPGHRPARRPPSASRCVPRSTGSAPTVAPRPATRSTARCGRSARATTTARPPRSCCCPTARPRPGRDPAEVAREAARPACRSTPSRSAPPTASSKPTARSLRVPPDPEALREIARLSGGATFAAEDADALDEVYERLGSQIGTREEKREISAGFAAAGLLLLGGSLAASLRWRGRLP